MFNRILISTFAAATLLTAAPALAADGTASKEPCSCCSDGSIHEVDHAVRLRAAEQRKSAAERKAQQPKTEDDPYIRNQSFGG